MAFSTRTSKAMLQRQTQDTNELLKEIGVDFEIELEWVLGQPKILRRFDNGSHTLSMRESKPNLEATLYAIRHILYEIGRDQWQERRDAE